MTKGFLYKKLTDVLTNIAKDLGASGAIIFDTSGLPIAKYTSAGQETEYLLKYVTWMIMMIDKLISNFIGKHKKIFILDDSNKRIIVKQIDKQHLKFYLSIITPIETPIGIILFESEFIEKEIDRLESNNTDIRKEQAPNIGLVDEVRGNDEIKELLNKIENHPLFKLLSSTGRKYE